MSAATHLILCGVLSFLGFRELEKTKRHAAAGRGLAVLVGLIDVALTLVLAAWVGLTA